MALDDRAVVVPGAGHVYVAPVGTPAPTTMDIPESPWRDLGHTSIEDGLTITHDGGDSDVLGTWQNAALRERRDPVVFAITLHLLQISNDTLSLYFGGGDASTAGVFSVNLIPQPQEMAVFIRIEDGNQHWPIYIPKTSIGSDDDVEVDVEELLAFPIRMTILGITGKPLLQFFDANLGLQNNEIQLVTVTGTPTGGTFTLTFDGQTTAGIAFDATAAAVKSALAALSSVGGTANVAVSGSTSGPWTVEFQGSLADTNVAQMTADATGLTGGTTPAVTVTTSTEGG